jgi:hypothetical protein
VMILASLLGVPIHLTRPERVITIMLAEEY